MKVILKVCVVLSVSFSFSAFAKNCEETRLGMDIGSGSTKILVAQVDTCQKKIVKVLLKDAVQISFNEALAKSVNDRLSDEIISDGETKIGKLLEKARSFKPKKEAAVATSVFRKASNGKEIIKSYSRKFKMKFEIISQHEEAMLGYLSAYSSVPESLKAGKEVVAWDIGGGSMQILYINKKKEILSYLGDLASVTYKNMVLEALELKNPEVITSPNPTAPVKAQAIGLSRSYAKIHVPAEIKKVVKDALILGVGGVHGISILNQTGLKDAYTQDDLRATINRLSVKEDKDLVGEYKATDVTNLMLVLGFMEGLEINKVNIVTANLLEGLMLQ